MIPQQPKNWPQSQSMVRMSLMPSASTPASTTPAHDRSGSTAGEHTNLMERTREDELLGTSATMSNVLYCNANHPELKQQFPSKTNHEIYFSVTRTAVHFSLSLHTIV